MANPLIVKRSEMKIIRDSLDLALATAFLASVGSEKTNDPVNNAFFLKVEKKKREKIIPLLLYDLIFMSHNT